MKTFLRILLIVLGLIAVVVLATALLTPWMDRWGATDEEITASYAGDELVASPVGLVNRAVTINAKPEQIYPWIVQLGAGKGGYYSYSWFETNVLRCPLVNADRIHPEWQDLKVGDKVEMCPDQPVPPPYTVAMLKPDKAVVLGQLDDGKWAETWQFVLVPQADGTTRLILRTRTTVSGAFWSAIHPGVFVMERGMLQGIKERAELVAQAAAE